MPHTNTAHDANKALDMHNKGRTKEAAILLDKIHNKHGMTLAVEHARALIASGINRYDIALQHWSNCARMKPTHHDFWYNWALSLDKIGRREQAKDICMETIKRFPGEDKPLVLMGIMTNDKRFYEKALNINPNNIHALCNMASFVDGQLARQYLEKAVEIDPLNPEANTGVAFHLFLDDDYENGWKRYEHRKRNYMASAQINTDAMPWRGEPVDGKTFVVIGEQGIGDECMFLTGLNGLRRAKSVSVMVDTRLIDVVQCAYPWASVGAYKSDTVDGVVHRSCEVDADYYLPCADLWRYCDERSDSLKVDAAIKFDKPTVGICWRSGMEGRVAWPGIDWAEALIRDHPHKQFVNMQYSISDDEINRLLQYDNFMNLDVDLFGDVGINCQIALGCELVIGPATAPMMFAKCCGANAVFVKAGYWWRGMFGDVDIASMDEIRERLK